MAHKPRLLYRFRSVKSRKKRSGDRPSKKGGWGGGGHQQQQTVQGGYDSKLIPIVNGSSNCVRLNEHDTAVADFNRSRTQAVSEGTQIIKSARTAEPLVHIDKGCIF